MRPMLASPAAAVPTGDGWAHEVKWDGMRILADVQSAGLRLWSRTERDVTAAFPELAGLVDTFDDMLLDGEVVALKDGVPSFQALAERFHVTNSRRAAALAATNPVTFMVFDLLRLYGVDLTARSFADRRATLERLELAGTHWQVPPTFSDGPLLHEATREQGLEGIVSKRLSSRYLPGTRSEDWRKSPHRTSLSVVIGGWRPETDSARLGAVLVGVPAPGGLRYLGRVGSGIAGKAGAALAADLVPLATSQSPFADTVPRVDAAGATWVHPVLVCEVQALGLTSQDRLRQPAYRGLRPDLSPGDIDLGQLPAGAVDA
ncbi:MAG: non-homologous end-joining DNA ligase [Actinomycetota bacterium]|nr:non-homologous end-joining DNA ligase [Actinomycetota bacterium]